MPLVEIASACFLIKYHLRDYIGAAGLEYSAVDLYQGQELQHLIGNFFDKCVYYTVKGSETGPRENVQPKREPEQPNWHAYPC